MTTSRVNPSPTTGWRDPAADPEVRLDTLIADMTLAENNGDRHLTTNRGVPRTSTVSGSQL